MGNRYEVHSRSPFNVAVPLKDTDGETMTAQKTMVIVELIALDHRGGNINEVVSTKDGANFVPGSVVEHQGWKVVMSAADRAKQKAATPKP